MYLTQNLFPPGKLSRTISLNSHYMIVFKNPRDSLGISTSARQMYPHNTNFLLQSFQDATKKPYGYLLLDLHQLTPANMRLRTNILPGEKHIVYVGLNINLVIVYSINCFKKYVLSVVLSMGLGQMKTHTHTSFLTTMFIETTFY